MTEESNNTVKPNVLRYAWDTLKILYNHDIYCCNTQTIWGELPSVQNDPKIS